MALGSAIEAGRAFVKFLLDDKELNKGLAGIANKLQKFGAIGMASMTPVLTAFGGFAMAAADTGGALIDMSGRTGMSVETLSELGYVAEQTGASLEDVEKAAHFLQKNGLDPNKFQEIAEKVAEIPDPVKRAQAAMKAFGKRTGPALLPMIDGLAEGIKRARELNLVMSTEDAKAADDLGDAMGDVKDQLGALAVAMGVAVAGPLTDFLRASTKILSKLIQFVKDNPSYVRAVGALAGGIWGLSAASYAFGKSLTAIQKHPVIATVVMLGDELRSLHDDFKTVTNSANGFYDRMQAIVNRFSSFGALMMEVGQWLFGGGKGGGTSPKLVPSDAEYFKSIRTSFPNVGMGSRGGLAAQTVGMSGAAGNSELVRIMKQVADNTDGMRSMMRHYEPGILCGTG